jgi:hypothetical protein
VGEFDVKATLPVEEAANFMRSARNVLPGGLELHSV